MTTVNYSEVTDVNVAKVESFLVQQIKMTGKNPIELTVKEISEGSNVALATAHKGIKELVKRKTITAIKPSSRRFKISYRYNKDIAGFDIEQNLEAQLEYLTEMTQIQKSEIEALRGETARSNRERDFMADDLRRAQNIIKKYKEKYGDIEEVS